jgi:hypothetical protein
MDSPRGESAPLGAAAVGTAGTLLGAEGVDVGATLAEAGTLVESGVKTLLPTTGGALLRQIALKGIGALGSATSGQFRWQSAFVPFVGMVTLGKAIARYCPNVLGG